MSTLYYESSFAHHGILGMKWGVRRYQNRDGTLTWEGKNRVEEKAKQALSSNSVYIPKEHMDALHDSINELKDYMEPARELHNNEELLRKYAMKSAEHDMKEWAEPGESVEITDDMLYEYMYGDLNQGDGSALAFYLKDKGIGIREYESGYMTRFEKYQKATSDIADDMMKQFGSLDFRTAMAQVNHDEVKYYTDLAVSDHYFINELVKKGYYLD